MKVGVPKEIKDQEHRVALTPDGARYLAQTGHEVRVQQGAGSGSGFSNEEYRSVGARLVSAADAWNVDLVLKVKEPLEREYEFLAGQMLFTYLHLAGVTPALTSVLLEAGTTAIAYETVRDAAGKLPLLAPMSAVAGDMAVTIGAYYLARFNGGKGVLLGTVLGAPHGKVLILGDGVVGRHAARTAAGMGTGVVIVGRHEERAAALRAEIAESLAFVRSTAEDIARELEDTDVLIGAVLSPGSRAPQLVTAAMVRAMQRGSVIVDVSIDQGGCVATSRPTSHSEPTFEEHGVCHYCVTNMPGAYPRTSTIALTSATLPYAARLADRGIDALRDDEGFKEGVNVFRGFVTCSAVSEALDLKESLRAFDDVA